MCINTFYKAHLMANVARSVVYNVYIMLSYVYSRPINIPIYIFQL